jgi:hypothetical protein
MHVCECPMYLEPFCYCNLEPTFLEFGVGGILTLIIDTQCSC